MTQKNRYLALYDYETGGVWIFIYARSEDEITQKYPELKIMDESKHQSALYPANATAAEKAALDRRVTFDIDDPPSSFLLTLVNSRSKNT